LHERPVGRGRRVVPCQCSEGFHSVLAHGNTRVHLIQTPASAFLFR
jgi:hypothetical protein